MPTIGSSGLGNRFQQLSGANSVDFPVTSLWSISGGEYFCEVPAMLQLSCVDTWINEVEMYAAVVVIKVIPVGLILFSYINIVRSVVRIQSSEGRKKAFNTCGSHLLVVVMFYGSAISGYAYMAPKSNSAKLKGKLLALFYGLVTPMLNPLIYTLRNKDVKEAVKKLLGRELEQGWNMA